MWTALFVFNKQGGSLTPGPPHQACTLVTVNVTVILARLADSLPQTSSLFEGATTPFFPPLTY